ncbi:Uncharacterized protein dnm_024410 [Desulfonema magnum]|uniref:Uncharacterized protein n=1 Tax=Desulfonema magnum TaxID=45655 RepID=A0A975BJJ1_9BACT|nr:Uncharacterized protein dnm_024410 [Desulfonema magnum]
MSVAFANTHFPVLSQFSFFYPRYFNFATKARISIPPG